MLIRIIRPIRVRLKNNNCWNQLLAIVGNYCFSKPQKEAREPIQTNNFQFSTVNSTNFCTQEQFDDLKNQTIQISQQLYKLIEYLGKK